MSTSFSWLDRAPSTLGQAIDEWCKGHDKARLEAWLLTGNRSVGHAERITTHAMEDFVQGVLSLESDAASAYSLPIDWPAHSIEKTQALRDIMLMVPAWAAQSSQDEQDWSLVEVLYPTEANKRTLASNQYSPGFEAWRMHVGMPPNEAWWLQLPLWSAQTKERYAKNTGWEHLLTEVLKHSHPEQGTRLALLAGPTEAIQKARVDAGGEQDAFNSPSVAQVLASDVEGKIALALRQAYYCPRNAIPDPAWWSTWDHWGHEEPQRCETAFATVLLSIVHAKDNPDSMVRAVLVSWASLREPPKNYSVKNWMDERKKYETWSLEDLAKRALPFEQRTIRFFDGLASPHEQLLLHYQALVNMREPDVQFDNHALAGLFSAENDPLR